MKIRVDLECAFCHSIHSVEVDLDDFLKWQNGELIQNAMPYLSATEREQLISGVCPECQSKIFRED